MKAIKSRRLKWRGHVNRMKDNRSVFKIIREKRTTGRLDVERETTQENEF